MKKKAMFKYGIMIMLVAIILVSIYLVSAFSTKVDFKMTKIEPTIINLTIQTDYYSSVNDYEKISEIAGEVANSHEYELFVYDCTDFSKELIKRLRKEGYKAQCTAGYNYAFDYINHTWVSVWINGERFEIESTGGYFISDEEYKTYKVRWENYCW